jgi:hypothetical protein
MVFSNVLAVALTLGLPHAPGQYDVLPVSPFAKP